MAFATRLGAPLMAWALIAPAQSFAAGAGDPNGNVCLVTFSSAGHAQNLDGAYVAAASVMPRATAEKLVNDYSKIYVYRDADKLARACACLSNPMPANTLKQRQDNLVACPKPDSVN
jgi:hypothetical protein